MPWEAMKALTPATKSGAARQASALGRGDSRPAVTWITRTFGPRSVSGMWGIRLDCERVKQSTR